MCRPTGARLVLLTKHAGRPLQHKVHHGRWMWGLLPKSGAIRSHLDTDGLKSWSYRRGWVPRRESCPCDLMMDCASETFRKPRGPPINNHRLMPMISSESSICHTNLGTTIYMFPTLAWLLINACNSEDYAKIWTRRHLNTVYKLYMSVPTRAVPNMCRRIYCCQSYYYLTDTSVECIEHQSNYNRANDVTVWQRTPTTADVTVTKLAGYVRVRILVNRWFFSYFGDTYFRTYCPFVEYMNIYAASWLCTHDVSNVGGVTASPARRNSSIVGVSLRARWDTGQVRHNSSIYN